MPGHLFIVQSDLTRLACDAWLLPTGRSLQIRSQWLRGAPISFLQLVTGSDRPEDNDYRHPRTWFFNDAIPTSDAWHRRSERTFAAPHWGSRDQSHRPWITQVVVNTAWSADKKAEWIAESARQFVEQAATELKQNRKPPSNSRQRHLLALPVVGTGHGGGWTVAGQILRRLISILMMEAARCDVDVVLVTYTRDQLAAAQKARRDLQVADPEVAFGGLPVSLRKVGKELADRSSNGKLVLFIGAGASMGAGLPRWSELLDLLAKDPEMDEASRAALKNLDVTDQARIIGDRLDRWAGGSGSSPVPLQKAIRNHVTTDRFSLTHAFLANLGVNESVNESVTTNYDTLFEEASAAAGHKVAVLPYEATGESGRWLLKMHGCVNHLEDIVLTREDFLRYADRRGALAGIVQALLITRHMLFVGFSLADENFLRIVDQVRKVVRLPNVSGAEQTHGPFGTALMIGSSPLLAELWRDDIDCIGLAVAEPEVPPVDATSSSDSYQSGAAQLELLLDYVVYEANRRISHLLDRRYEGLLSDNEVTLRNALIKLRDTATPDIRGLPAWKPVAAMLASLGGDLDGRQAHGLRRDDDYS